MQAYQLPSTFLSCSAWPDPGYLRGHTLRLCDSPVIKVLHIADVKWAAKQRSNGVGAMAIVVYVICLLPVQSDLAVCFTGKGYHARLVGGQACLPIHAWVIEEAV